MSSRRISRDRAVVTEQVRPLRPDGVSAEPTGRLCVDQLVVGYGPVPVVRGMSLTADPGQLVAVIGPNGSGKSTLIKGIMGIVKPAGGTVEYGGRQLRGLRPDEIVRAGIGYVPQVADVFDNLTISENLEVGGYVGRKGRPQRKSEVLDIFPVLGGKLKQNARTLSGGERRTLAVARALMARPSAILLDEPSAGLAPAAVRLLQDHLRALRDSGLVLVVVEQNVRAVLAIADEVHVLVDGQSVLTGTGNELGRDLHALGRVFMGEAASIAAATADEPSSPRTEHS